MLNEADILLNFFRFYSSEFDTNRHAIDISQLQHQPISLPQSHTPSYADFFSGKSIVDKADTRAMVIQSLYSEDNRLMEKEVDENNRVRLRQYTESNLLDKWAEYKYAIVDPFSHTYNPARNIEMHTSNYPGLFKSGF